MYCIECFIITLILLSLRKAGKRTKKKKKKKKNKKSNPTNSTSSVARYGSCLNRKCSFWLSDAKIVKRVKQSKKRSRIEAALANPFPSDFGTL